MRQTFIQKWCILLLKSFLKNVSNNNNHIPLIVSFSFLFLFQQKEPNSEPKKILYMFMRNGRRKWKANHNNNNNIRWNKMNKGKHVYFSYEIGLGANLLKYFLADRDRDGWFVNDVTILRAILLSFRIVAQSFQESLFWDFLDKKL